jgi:hypothetical protein
MSNSLRPKFTFINEQARNLQVGKKYYLEFILKDIYTNLKAEVRSVNAECAIVSWGPWFQHIIYFDDKTLIDFNLLPDDAVLRNFRNTPEPW